MSKLDYDHIVVGAGISGSCAAYQLAKRGKSVLLLEKFPLPHSRGSSHGQSRIIRKAYPDPVFQRLMDEAYREWGEIQNLHGSSLMKETGLLCFADEEENAFLTGVISSFSMSPGSRHTVYQDDHLRREFPQLRFRKPLQGCLDHSAGVLMADKALQAVQSLAVSYGAEIIDGFTVDKVEDCDTWVQVTGEGEGGSRQITCKSVCLCPGPWAGPLLGSVGLRLPLTPVKIPVYYWRGEQFLPHSFIYDVPGKADVWGLPSLEYPGLVKICLHNGAETDPDTRDGVSTEHLKQFLKEFIGEHFPDVEPEVAVEESCIYTLTPDQNPIIDRVTDKKNILIAVGFSGMGFKLGPVTGRMLADMAMEQTVNQEEDILAIGRF